MNFVRSVLKASAVPRLVRTNVAAEVRWTRTRVPFSGEDWAERQKSLMSDNVRLLASFNTITPGFCQKRFVHRSRQIKLPPTKPLNFDFGGDLSHDGVVALSPAEPKLEFSDIPELENADPIVKQMFSLEFADGNGLKEKELSLVLKQIQDNPGDFASLEVRIAKATVHIRRLIKHCLKFRKDKVNKVKLIKALVIRRSNLKQLQEHDKERFDWIQEVLGIKYIPLPKYHKFKLSKRATRKKIAREACWAEIERKMQEYKKKLEVERKQFEILKERELSEISEELQKIGFELKPTVQETVVAMGEGQGLFKKERYRKRRYALLEKKFELYGQHKRDRGADPRVKLN